MNRHQHYDPISTLRVEELVQELKEKYTIIMVTHNMQQAARVSDKTAFFLNGYVNEYDDTDKISLTHQTRKQKIIFQEGLVDI